MPIPGSVCRLMSPALSNQVRQAGWHVIVDGRSEASLGYSAGVRLRHRGQYIVCMGPCMGLVHRYMCIKAAHNSKTSASTQQYTRFLLHIQKSHLSLNLSLMVRQAYVRLITLMPHQALLERPICCRYHHVAVQHLQAWGAGKGAGNAD